MADIPSFQDHGAGSLIETSLLPMIALGRSGGVLRQNAASRALFGDGGILASLASVAAGADGAPGGEVTLETLTGPQVFRLFARPEATPEPMPERLFILLPDPGAPQPERSGLHSLSRALGTARSMAEVATAICSHLPDLFPGTSGRCYLPGLTGYQLEPLGQWGRPAAGAVTIRALECWGFRRGGLHDIGFTDQVKPPCRHIGTEVRPYACLPLRAQGAVLGLLHVVFDRLPPMLADRQHLLATLRAMAETVSLGILHSGIAELVQGQILRDPETGTYTRSFMMELLGREIPRMIRAKRPLTVVVLQPDAMARITADFGPDGRAFALREFARLLLTFRKGSDVACRYDADRFALVLPDMNAAQAEKRLQHFQDEAAALTPSFRDRPLPSLTCGVGAAIYPDNGATPQDLLQVAEQALLRAKAQGPGTTVIAAPSG